MAASAEESGRDESDGGIQDQSTPAANREGGPGQSGPGNRKRAVLAVLPFLALGIADVLLLLRWGIDPLWGFVILPPILFCSALAYLVFSTDFLEDRT